MAWRKNFFFFSCVVKQNQIDNEKKKRGVMDKESDLKTTQAVIIT